MVDGSLPSAPIHNDIRNLRLFPENDALPEMIVGGFPCTDVSAIGLQKGISTDTRSGLFFEIMRIVDENPSIKVLFLENVANIVRCGLKDVIEELCKRGFSFAWSHKSAGSLGAPHVRSRWFCLAYRGDVDIGRMFPVDGEVGVTNTAIWQTEPTRRYSFKPCSGIVDNTYDDNWILRSQTLGNTVCPVVVRSAFVELVRLMRNKQAIIDIFKSFGSLAVNRLKYPFPETGLVTDDRFYSIPSMNLSIKDADESETDAPAQVDITLKMPDGKVLNPIHYPTPRRGITHACSLTERSTRDLPSVLLHSEQALDGMTAEMSEALGQDVERPDKPQGIVIQNVNYVEWMMGYPADWTRVSKFERPVKYSVAAASNDADDGLEYENEYDGEVGTRTKGSKSARKSTGTSTTTTTTKQPYKMNGMHVLMRENKGLDVRAISEKWRSLTDAERQEYSRKAKELSENGNQEQQTVAATGSAPIFCDDKGNDSGATTELEVSVSQG
jgi:DNA (cytosine-5)-methyltransferase 1